MAQTKWGLRAREEAAMAPPRLTPTHSGSLGMADLLRIWFGLSFPSIGVLVAIALRRNDRGWNVPKIAGYLEWTQLFADEYDLAIAIAFGLETRAGPGQYTVERFRFN